MAHTNSTPNYNLPQFLGTDKPAWLTDINNAMSVIDTAIAAAKTTADTADTAVNGLAVTVGNHTSQLSTLSGAVTSQGNTLNAVTSLIGNGVPTTTDKTIIGAINELDARTKYTVLKTATANTTYAAQMAELKAVFDTLTNDEKVRTAVIDGYIVYKLVDVRGRFTKVELTNDGYLSAACVKLDAGIYISGSLLTTPTYTVTDVSANTNAGSLILVSF